MKGERVKHFDGDVAGDEFDLLSRILEDRAFTRSVRKMKEENSGPWKFWPVAFFDVIELHKISCNV